MAISKPKEEAADLGLDAIASIERAASPCKREAPCSWSWRGACNRRKHLGSEMGANFSASFWWTSELGEDLCPPTIWEGAPHQNSQAKVSRGEGLS